MGLGLALEDGVDDPCGGLLVEYLVRAGVRVRGWGRGRGRVRVTLALALALTHP